MEAGWSLIKASDKTVALRKAIRSPHTAEFSDSLVGVTRLRMAVQGAVRNNRHLAGHAGNLPLPI